MRKVLFFALTFILMQSGSALAGGGGGGHEADPESRQLCRR